MKKVLSNKFNFLLAAHHGSGNSMTDVYEAMTEKGWVPKQVVISGISDPST
ncbi:hypothetical protein [Mesoplasma melaleucae]|nr:hypothetical protein [Mesoplasma melaleucae]